MVGLINMLNNFDDQFTLEREYYLKQLDFLNWFRYFHLLSDILKLDVKYILEIGTGSGVLKNCVKPLVSSYSVLDINEKLSPDIVADVRIYQPKLEALFDCVVAADVLEHLPFSDLTNAVSNLYGYLKPGGYALITIPHRQSNFLFMSPTQKPHVFTVPTGFLSIGAFYRRFIKRRIWIDPSHCWEIGDGNIRVADVQQSFHECNFRIDKFEKLLYVDYWILHKPQVIK